MVHLNSYSHSLSQSRVLLVLTCVSILVKSNISIYERPQVSKLWSWSDFVSVENLLTDQ